MSPEPLPPLIRSRVPAFCFGRPAEAPATQPLAASSVADADVFPSPSQSPRVDVLPASYDTERWTAADWQHFREVQAEMWEEHRRPTTGYEQEVGALLNRPTMGEPPAAANEQKRDDTAREKDMAFEYFCRMELSALENQHAASTEMNRIARSIASTLGRSEGEVRRRLGGYRQEFLQSKAK